MACFANFCILRAWWLVHRTIGWKQWCFLRTNNFLDWSLSIHLSSDLHKPNSDLFLRALSVSSHGPFCQFLLIARMVACAPHNCVWKNSMVRGAQASMRALCKNCQNGPWEDTGNALRSKSVFSLCKSDDKWMLSDQSRIFPFLLKKNRKIGIGLRGVWGESEMSKTSKNFFLSFLMSFLVNLSKKMKLPFLTQNIGIRSP